MKMTSAQFKSNCQQFDLNNDGRIDSKDLKAAEINAHVEGIARTVGGLFFFGLGAKLIGSEHQQKLEAIQKLLKADNNGVIDKSDVSPSKGSQSYRNYGRSSSNCSSVPTQSSVSTQAQVSNSPDKLTNTLKELHNKAEKEIDSLSAKLENTKDPNEAKNIMLKIQEQKDLQAFIMQMRTSMQKRNHDTMMAIARNMA